MYVIWQIGGLGQDCHIPIALTHWGRVTHICVGYLFIIGSDNGSLSGRRQAIIQTNAGILLIGPLQQTSVKFESEFKHFHWRKYIWKCRLGNVCHYLGLNGGTLVLYWTIEIVVVRARYLSRFLDTIDLCWERSSEYRMTIKYSSACK